MEILQKLLNISSITEKKTIQEDIYNVEYFIEYIELLISVYEYIINPENNTVIIDNNSILIYTLSSLKEKLKECEEEQQLCNVEYINIMIKKYRYRIISLYQILKPINIYIEKYNSKLEISKYLLSKYTTYKDYIFKNPNTRAFDLLLLTGTDCSKLRDELNVEKEKIKLIGYSKIYNRDDQQLENIELCDINVVEKENEDPNKISNLNIKLKKLSSVDDLYINEIEKEDNSIINELDEKLKKLHDVGYYNTYFTTEITKEEKNIKNLTKIIDEYDLLLDLFINKK